MLGCNLFFCFCAALFCSGACLSVPHWCLWTCRPTPTWHLLVCRASWQLFRRPGGPWPSSTFRVHSTTPHPPFSVPFSGTELWLFLFLSEPYTITFLSAIHDYFTSLTLSFLTGCQVAGPWNALCLDDLAQCVHDLRLCSQRLNKLDQQALQHSWRTQGRSQVLLRQSKCMMSSTGPMWSLIPSVNPSLPPLVPFCVRFPGWTHPLPLFFVTV